MVNHNGIHLVSPSILGEIISKSRDLFDRLEYRFKFGKNPEKMFRAEDIRHSVSIETQSDLRVPRSERAKMHSRSSADLHNALSWGLRHYSEPLTEGFIKALGVVIDPANLNSREIYDGYRSIGVSIRGASISPPAAGEVPQQMRVFLLQNEMLTHPVDRAVHAHFNLARIHPYVDGNGRLARLVQNIILYRNELPPAAVKISEREDYIELVRRADESYYSLYHFNLPKSEKEEYRKLYSDFTENITPSSWHRDTAKHFLRRMLTRDQANLYNFLALKVSDNLDFQKKLLEGKYPHGNGK